MMIHSAIFFCLLCAADARAPDGDQQIAALTKIGTDLEAAGTKFDTLVMKGSQNSSAQVVRF